MSQGKQKNYSQKGSNMPHQLAVVRNLANILAAVGPGGGLATEATLLQVLGALQNGQEFEQNLVMDLGGAGCPGNCPTYLQIRIYNTETHTFEPPIYYNAAGVVVVPVGPLQIVNPQFVLESILTQLTAINTDLDVALSTRASEATALLQLAQLVAINADLDVALSTRASEATLAGVLTTVAFQARINTFGQKTMANSTPVVLPSDQSTLNVNIAPIVPISSFRGTAVTNAAQAVKGAAGDVWGWNIINPNNQSVFVKIYNVVAGSVTVGTTVPVMTLQVPPRGSVYQNPAEAQLINGTAISVAAVDGLADSDTTAPAVAIHVEIKYK